MMIGTTMTMTIMTIMIISTLHEFEGFTDHIEVSDFMTHVM